MRVVLFGLIGILLLCGAVWADSVSVSFQLPPGKATNDPVVRFVPLTTGEVAGEIRLAGAGGEEPAGVVAGDPVRVRGMTVLPLLLHPSRPDDVEIFFREEGGSERAAVPADRGFFDPLFGLLPKNDGLLGASEQEGSYLVVTAPTFLSTLEPLVQWKREMGFTVQVATTEEAGTTNEEIRGYIRGLYDSSPLPPQYVLLVGDVDRLPAFDFHQTVSDLPYALMDGDDFLPDLEVGRLPVETTEELATVVAKIVRYESDPYRGAEGDWFSRALLVAADFGSPTPVPVSRWCRERLEQIGFAQVDSVYWPGVPWNSAVLIRGLVDQGVSLISYRGWAYGYQGWEPPKFTINDIPGLNNGWMTPVVFSFVCHTGDFAEADNPCFGEVWLRAGSATEAKGAVGFIGNSDPWSHTRHNDAAALGAFRALDEGGVRRLGGILGAIKYEIYEQFFEEMDYETYGDNSVEVYFYIYSLLGDPAMEVWTAAPRPILVGHPDTLFQGATVVEVSVRDEAALEEIAGARVGVVQGENLLGCAWTDETGTARVLLDGEEDAVPVRITVTGTGVLPYQVDIPVGAGDPYVALGGVELSDGIGGVGEGNGDGAATPGEVVALSLLLENRGSQAVSGAMARLQTPSGATASVSEIPLPDLPPGGSVAPGDSFLVAIDGEGEDGQVLPFGLEIIAAPDTFAAGFDITLRAPDLAYRSHLLAEGSFAPGDTAGLSITIGNDGSLAAGAGDVVLRSLHPEIAVVLDSVASIASVGAGGTAAIGGVLRVAAGESVAVGQAAVFTLEIATAGGYRAHTGFSLVVGDVDHHAPFGPDQYGYYAYDNSDTDYPDAAPVYEWIPCSPAYGGAGTALDLTDEQDALHPEKAWAVVTLPFAFDFYGEEYRRLLVHNNGFVSFDTTETFDFFNWSIPSTFGGGAVVAPFWDNLDPTKEYEGVRVGDGVYVWDDTSAHRFVIEWSRVGSFYTQNERRQDYDDLQTFQLVLYDPDERPTPTGDGVIRFQYKQIFNNDSGNMYATVGIEDKTEEIGLEYSYFNAYPAACAPLSAGLAVELTTEPPVYRPFVLARFRAERSEGSVLLSWEPADLRPRLGYKVYRSSGESLYPVHEGFLGGGATGFLDEGADPDSVYTYTIGSFDPFGRETLLGPFPYPDRVDPLLKLSLSSAGPNPFGVSTRFAYALPKRAPVRLHVYNVSGRLVRTLLDGAAGPGLGLVSWDGRDRDGKVVPSGVYFVRLEVGGERRTTKVLLVR